MISKEEVTELQKLHPLLPPLHSVAACIISGNIFAQNYREHFNFKCLSCQRRPDAEGEYGLKHL